jgi:hypothetical protein
MPNHALRNAIEEFLTEKGVSFAAPSARPAQPPGYPPPPKPLHGRTGTPEGCHEPTDPTNTATSQSLSVPTTELVGAAAAKLGSAAAKAGAAAAKAAASHAAKAASTHTPSLIGRHQASPGGHTAVPPLIEGGAYTAAGAHQGGGTGRVQDTKLTSTRQMAALATSVTAKGLSKGLSVLQKGMLIAADKLDAFSGNTEPSAPPLPHDDNTEPSAPPFPYNAAQPMASPDGAGWGEMGDSPHPVDAPWFPGGGRETGRCAMCGAPAINFCSNCGARSHMV